jgi:hypothetical protein
MFWVKKKSGLNVNEWVHWQIESRAIGELNLIIVLFAKGNRVRWLKL